MNVPEPDDKTFVLMVRGNVAEARARAFEILGLKPAPRRRGSRGAMFGRQAASRGRAWTFPEIVEAIREHARAHEDRPPTTEEWRYAGEGHPTYSRVVRVCGSWPDAIEQAGYPRPRRGRPSRRVSGRTSSIA